MILRGFQISFFLIIESYRSLQITVYKKEMVQQLNLWVTSGTGNFPRVRYKAYCRYFSSLKPHAFSIVGLALLLNPSIIPEESPGFVSNRFILSSCFSLSILETFFMGPGLVRLVRVHHFSENFAAIYYSIGK